MRAPAAIISGIIQRLLPSAFVDDREIDRPARFMRYGEVGSISLIRKQYGLIDEGSYFVAHNAQTGIASSLISTVFAEATLSPYLIITNTDSGDRGRSIFLDYLNLFCTAAGAAAAGLTNLMFAWSIDQSSTRFSTGGTDLNSAPASTGGIFSPNTGISKRTSVAQINIGALTLNAPAPATRRIIVPQRLLRVQNSATAAGAVADEFRMNFGSVEHANPSSLVDLTAAKTVGYREHFQLPGMEIAPGHCAVLHLWSPGAALTTGVSFLPELGWFER